MVEDNPDQTCAFNARPMPRNCSSQWRTLDLDQQFEENADIANPDAIRALIGGYNPVDAVTSSAKSRRRSARSS